MSSESLSLINSISVTCDADDQPRTLESMVRVLSYYNFALDTIRKSITQEVKETGALNTLFRTNTITTKLMSAHLRIILTPFLASLIPLIKEIIVAPDSFEVDPTKLKDPTQLDANVATLVAMSRRFVDWIVLRLDDFPRSLKIISKHLQATVSARFPGPKMKSIIYFPLLIIVLTQRRWCIGRLYFPEIFVSLNFVCICVGWSGRSVACRKPSITACYKGVTGPRKWYRKIIALCILTALQAKNLEARKRI